MELSSVFLASGVAALVAMILYFLPLTPMGKLWPTMTNVNLARLEARYDEIAAANNKLWIDYNEKLIEYTEAYHDWTHRETGYQNRIALLEAEVQQLRARIRDLESRVSTKTEFDADDLIVIGIWPDESLDVNGERDALYNAGFDYWRISGVKATRSGVIQELRRAAGRRMIIEVGAHGTNDGLILHDGITEPGWWRRVLSDRNVYLIVLLSCDSENIADALISEGISAVISVRAEIEDDDAATFARELYRNLSDNVELNQAVDNARLHVSRETWEMIRIRYA